MKYHIVTLGCPKNIVDSEGMHGILTNQGHTQVDEVQDADLVIVNTCSFIEAARTEALEVLDELVQHKQPHQRFVAAGCMAESHANVFHTVAGVDATLSTRQWMTIDTLLNELSDTPVPRAVSGDPVGDQPAINDWRTQRIQRSAATPSAYVKISDGCALCCSFCTIPTIKGSMRSKSPDAILGEIQELINQGVHEIVLVAQHLTDYGRDLGMREGLSTLLDDICTTIPSDRWVRLLYAYPQSVTPRLIETMARHPQICNYLDMPLQHAHPAVLRRMNRIPDRERTQRIINDLRTAMPDIALRTTCIVGFPGETNREFQTLLDFLQDVAFDWVGAFHYSQEPGTPAATLPNQVAPSTIDKRWHRLMQTQQPISLSRNQQQVGREFDVLVEGIGATDDEQPVIVGRSFREAPDIDGTVFALTTASVGDVIRVRMTHATPYDMWGTHVAPDKKNQVA